MRPYVIGLMLAVFVVMPAYAKKKPQMTQRCRSVEAFEGRRLSMKMLVKHATKIQVAIGFGRKEALGRETELTRGPTSLYGGVVGYVNARGGQIAENPNNPSELTAIFSANGARHQVTFACEWTPFDFNV